MKILRSSSSLLSALCKLCFYLFFAFLPFQVDALVLSADIFYSGFYNPYLSHFVYLSDVFLIAGFLLFGLGLLFLRSFRKSVENFRFGNLSVFYAILGFFAVNFLTIFWSVDPLNSVMYFIRGFEFFGLYLLIVNDFLDLRRIFYVLVGVISFEALIGIFQYVSQESLGFRFFGEPIVSSGSLGVAKVSLFGSPLLRVYGTFSHPNLFAGYLVFAILLILNLFSRNKPQFTLALFLCVSALFLTFSRSAALALICALGVILFQRKSSFVSAFILLLAVFLLFAFGFGDWSSISERIVYFNVSLDMFFDTIFGIGAGNFTAVMQNFSDVKLAPWLFQPVHNIYLLVANELGFIGLVSFLWLIWMVVKSAFSRKQNAFIVPMLCAVLVIGLFDHYFLTLYQGQALFWLTISLSSRL